MHLYCKVGHYGLMYLFSHWIKCSFNVYQCCEIINLFATAFFKDVQRTWAWKEWKNKSSFLDILQLKCIISAHSESQKSSLLEHHQCGLQSRLFLCQTDIWHLQIRLLPKNVAYGNWLVKAKLRNGKCSPIC